MSTHVIVATNLTDLHFEPSFLSELGTQILNGAALEILEESEKWYRVKHLEDGYTGWAYKSYLSDSAAPQPTHLIFAPVLTLLANPKADAEITTRMFCGTRVRMTEPANSDWVRIEPAGGSLPGGWALASGLRRIKPLPEQDARTQMIADARKLTGVYYLWGGASPFGIDCSGLSQLVHRLAGYSIPRDARDQFPAGRPVDPPFRPGDLLFFHSETDKSRITHVGISTSGWNIIHSSRSRNGVYEEDVQSNPALKNCFAGARTFLFR